MNKDNNSIGLRRKQFYLQEEDFFRNPLFHWIFLGVIILNALNWGLLLFFVHPIDFPTFLHYNVSLGADKDMIGSWRDIYLIPAVGIIFAAINIVLARYFYKRKERIVSHILLLASVMVQIAAIIGSVSVILFNN